MPDSLSMSDAMIELTASRFRVLGEPMRLRILQLLEKKERTVTELVAELSTSQPNVSRHLQALYAAQLVSRRRHGNSIYYAIADPMVFQLCSLVCQNAAERARDGLRKLAAPRRRR